MKVLIFRKRKLMTMTYMSNEFTLLNLQMMTYKCVEIIVNVININDV